MLDMINIEIKLRYPQENPNALSKRMSPKPNKGVNKYGISRPIILSFKFTENPKKLNIIKKIWMFSISFSFISVYEILSKRTNV